MIKYYMSEELQRLPMASGLTTPDLRWMDRMARMVDEMSQSKADLVGGKIPASQLPSYVDDVIEYDRAEDFPNPGEKGKIYVDTGTGKTYRWSGTQYMEISDPDLAKYAFNTPTVTPGSSVVWTANHSQIYDTFGELVDVSLPEWGTYSTSDGDKTGWFWYQPDMVYVLLSEDESATSLTMDWGGYHGEEYIPYTINFSKTPSPATVTNVADRAVNTFALSGNASLTLPNGVPDRSRDFYLKVTASAASTIAVTGATLKNGAGNMVALSVPAGATKTWRLVEMANGTFLVHDFSPLAGKSYHYDVSSDMTQALRDIIVALGGSTDPAE